MPNLGFGELVIVFLIVMLIFGAGRLPQIGEGIGKAIRNLKRGLNTDDDIDVLFHLWRVFGVHGIWEMMPAKSDPWVLGTFSEQRVEEDAEVVDKVETK